MRYPVTAALCLALTCFPLSFSLADESGVKSAEKPIALTPDADLGVSHVKFAPDTERLKIDFVYHDATGRQHPAWLAIDADGFALALCDDAGRDRIELAVISTPDDLVDASVAIGNDRLTVAGPPDEIGSLQFSSVWKRRRETVAFASRAEADSATAILQATPDHASRARLSGRERELYAEADKVRAIGDQWTRRVTSLGLLSKKLLDSPEGVWTVWRQLSAMVSTAEVDEMGAQRNMSEIVDAVKAAVKSISCDEPGS